MKTLLTRILSVSLLTTCSVASAADYQGADAVLQQASALAAEAPKPPHEPDENRQFRDAIKAFKERAPALSPEDAAQGWLDLIDRQLKMASKGSRPMKPWGRRPVNMVTIFLAIPPPTTWAALADKIQTRPIPTERRGSFIGQALRVLAAALQKNDAAGWTALDALEKQAATLDKGPGSGMDYLLQSLNAAMAKRTDSPQRAVGSFERQLAEVAQIKPDAQAQIMAFSGRGIEAPDLVTLVGPERAEALLRRLFALPFSDADFQRGEQTKALARRVALEMADNLKFAPWGLTQDLDAVDLYETLEKHFPSTTSQSNYGKQRADGYYLLGLVIKGRPADAAALAVKLGKRPNASTLNLPYHGLEELAQRGYAEPVAAFFAQVLQEHPELPYWKEYITAAALTGKTEPMIAFVRSVSERENLPPDSKLALRDAYGQALLAADRVPEGIKVWRDLLASTLTEEKSKADEKTASNDSKGWRGSLDLAVNLAGLGRLLGDNALLSEGLDACVALTKPDDGEVSPDTRDPLADLFLAAGRGPELEHLLAAALADDERKLRAQKHEELGHTGWIDPRMKRESASTQHSLAALVQFYHRAGRYQDVVALLDHARSWDAADLAALANRRYSGNDFGYEAARALQRTGKTAEALRVVNDYLDRNGGSDPAYALLIELSGPDAAARLDELFARDRFEERPLIWKATLRLGQGQLDEAETLIRKAIAIDPSDGEQGRGDRMRAYAVLADILARKGDAEQAEHMNQAVKAIRLSEEADRYHGAGLLTRAVAMYKEALGFFADAYCVQSRLAVQLAALGRMEEAEAHYTRAYELMPESFGRMESHCFGCEGAFRGAWAQNAAEKVFSRLAAQNPLKPQVPYLLGYLREEQGQFAKAVESYQQAVKLDPDYLNAWKHLAGLAEKSAERDAAILNLLRLDPLQRHESADLKEVSDLRALWQAVETANKSRTSAPTEVYPLAASKAALEEDERHPPPAGTSAPGGKADYEEDRDFQMRDAQVSAPEKALAGASLISAIISVLDQSAYNDELNTATE